MENSRSSSDFNMSTSELLAGAVLAATAITAAAPVTARSGINRQKELLGDNLQCTHMKTTGASLAREYPVYGRLNDFDAGVAHERLRLPAIAVIDKESG